MNNYRNNMPHYDSLPHDYNPMGLNERKYSNDKKLYFTNSRAAHYSDFSLHLSPLFLIKLIPDVRIIINIVNIFSYGLLLFNKSLLIDKPKIPENM
jgi:hypothetical protein